MMSDDALGMRISGVSSSGRVGLSRVMLGWVGVKIGVKDRGQLADFHSSSRAGEQDKARLGTRVFYRSEWKMTSRNQRDSPILLYNGCDRSSGERGQRLDDALGIFSAAGSR
jgi:hypothetical protein